MQVQVRFDHNIEGHEALAAHVNDVVENALREFSSHITRVEVHASDESSHKSGPHDMRCMMEARLERHQPVAITHQAKTLHQAIDGAAGKLTRLIEHTVGRRHDQQNRRTDPPPSESNPTEES